MRKYYLLGILFIFLFSVFIGCSNNGSPNGDIDLNSGSDGNAPADDIDLGSNSGGDGTGTVMLSLTDAPNKELEAVFVTINEVTVCKVVSDSVDADMDDDNEEEENCEWFSLMSVKGTYNLLTLTNGVTETLGIQDLPAGKYDQMRLMIGETPDSDDHEFANYLYFKDDPDAYELKIPSGIQSGIKLVHLFEVFEGRFKELILDFDAQKSVVQAGASGNYNLKPTIKVIDVENLAMVSGTVTEAIGDPIVGAKVYAFTENSGVYRQAGSATSQEGGYYSLPLEIGASYSIVAVSAGYEPSCSSYSPAVNGMEYIVDFGLTARENEITRNVEIRAFSNDVLLTTLSGFFINFKEQFDCGPNFSIVDLEIDILAQVEDPLKVSLPIGTYSYSTGATGHEPKVIDLVIDESTLPLYIPIDFIAIE